MRQRAMIAMALVERAQAADRGRADDGARRDRPGADPAPARGAPGSARDRDRDHHPRPRRGRRDRRPHRGHVRRADRRARHRPSEIFNAPEHPYTWGLLKSIPRLDNPRGEELVPISGRPPSLINRPSGLPLPSPLPVRAGVRTSAIDPRLESVDGNGGHAVACLLEHSVRKRIWEGLREGRDPDALKRIAASSEPPALPPERAADQNRDESLRRATDDGTDRGQGPGQALPDQARRPAAAPGRRREGGRRRELRRRAGRDARDRR